MASTNNTWFLPPDFTFFEDGDISLGTILKYPDRPTLALARLGEDEAPPYNIALPTVKVITEQNHTHFTGSGQSTGAKFLAKLVELASVSGSSAAAKYKDMDFGTVSHEVRLLSRTPSLDMIHAIVGLDSVKEYMDGGPFGRFKKRPIYLISGLRIAKSSFSVTTSAATTGSVSGQGSVPSGATLGGHLAVGIGTGASTSAKTCETHSFNTEPRVIFAYRLHVIRSKSMGGAESELFSDTAAFFTGEGDEDGDGQGQRVELVDATSETLRGGKGVKSATKEYLVDGETMVEFKV